MYSYPYENAYMHDREFPSFNRRRRRPPAPHHMGDEFGKLVLDGSHVKASASALVIGAVGIAAAYGIGVSSGSRRPKRGSRSKHLNKQRAAMGAGMGSLIFGIGSHTKGAPIGAAIGAAVGARKRNADGSSHVWGSR